MDTLASLPIAGVALGTVAVYLSIVHSLRYSRINALHASYAKRHGLKASPPLRRNDGRAPTRAELPMTPVEAQEIIKTGLNYEMPFILTKALEFALFKTYGIPTISDLLRYTSEFKDKKKAGRRYADTGILIFAFVTYPLVGPGSGAPATAGPVDPRSAVAVGRINYLHGRWASKISNDDLLYTLSTFILEPQVWASQFEWRPLTPVEEMAWMVFFSEIGRRMGITGIPQEISELIQWAEDYERLHMVPTESCRDVADATTQLLLFNVPQFARTFGEKVVACLLYDRLRESIMVSRPPAILKSIVQAALKGRGFAIRHFFVPRIAYFKKGLFPDDKPAFPKGYIPASSTATKSMKGSDGSASDSASASTSDDDSAASTAATSVDGNEKMYIEERKGLLGFLDSASIFLGIFRADQIPGASFKPQGLRLEECGPTAVELKGNEAVRKMAEAMQGCPLEGPYDIGGCPATRCPFAM
ncbi:hypothetical protein RQP46_007722 [Phenoliferia psychrophenolica]